jgi:SLT domain-containing protein
VLTRVEPRVGGPLAIYTLIGQDSSVGRYLGQLVEIKGKATNIGDDGKVEVTTKTKVEREHGDDTVTKSKAEIEGPSAPAYLGVRSVKMLRTSCR